MPRNGSGGFSLVTNSWNVATNGVSASAADWQSLISDVATAVQQSISADGQTPITGNLQMGGNRLTGLGAGSATGQSLRFEQLFSQGALVDIASAGLMDIGTPLTNFLRVTGSTTITGFGTNYNGPRYLIFAAAVILTHSATLVLPGAANITTGINDSLIAIPISGGWQVVAYQRASGLPATAGPLAASGITGAAASGANNDITSLTALTAINLPDNSITTPDVAPLAITAPKLSGGQAGTAPIYGARAWCTFVAATGAILVGGNVASVVRNSAGNYTITLSVAMQNADYAVIPSGGAIGSGPTACTAFPHFNGSTYVAPTTTVFRLTIQNFSGGPTDSLSNLSFSVFS